MAARAATRLLEAWRAGEAGALDELTPLVYEELRRIARRYMQSERPDHTLEATGLVNEALLRMAGSGISPTERAHFQAIAARSMRRVLVDHARARHSDKRGGGDRAATLRESEIADLGAKSADILDLDEALSRLAVLDARKCDIVVLHFFGGLTYDETATALDLSPATVHRELRLAKAWLINELEGA